MAQTRQFFVPDSNEADAEQRYAAFAAWCRRSVPDASRRIYSITYTHDGTNWTATVGETLRGVQVKRARSRGRTVERTLRRSDAAKVLAIFAPGPYLVVTNARPLSDLVSGWVNPFMAGEPTTVRYFDGPRDEAG